MPRSAAPTAKPAEVVIAVLVEAGHFGGLAADQRAAAFPAAFGDAGDDRRGGLGIELAAGEIVQKEQRFGALHHEVVDRHRHQVDADAAMQAGLDRDLDLGADAVGGGDQDRVLEARGLQVEQPAKPADFRVGAGAGGGANHRLDEVDQAVARIDVDARIRVSQPVFAVDHGLFQMMAAGYVGFRSRAMARKHCAHILCRHKHLRSQTRYLCSNDGPFLDVLMRRFDARKWLGATSGATFADLGLIAGLPCPGFNGPCPPSPASASTSAPNDVTMPAFV